MPIAFHMHLLTAFYMYLLRFTCIDCVLHVSTAFYMHLLRFTCICYVLHVSASFYHSRSLTRTWAQLPYLLPFRPPRANHTDFKNNLKNESRFLKIKRKRERSDVIISRHRLLPIFQSVF